MKKISLEVFLLIIISSTIGFSQAPFENNLGRILPSEFKNYKKVYRDYKELRKLINDDTYNECISFSKKASYCNDAAKICDNYNFTVSKLPRFPAQLYKQYGIFELFKPYCGNGECFQCCFTVNSAGCHVSFKGYPVLNCNDNYGPGTSPAGMTLIDDPNVVAGQPCLFTPQICVHLAICNEYLNTQQIIDLNNDTKHPIKSVKAIQQRAKTFAEFSMEYAFKNFTNAFKPGQALKKQDGTIIEEEIYSEDVYDFLYGRGHIYWSSLIDSLVLHKGNVNGFKIIDSTTKEFQPLPTLYNTTRRFFLSKFLSTIPNLYNRLAFTESKVWTKIDKNSYIGDPKKSDSTFLNFVHPIALSILSNNFGIQDYRLLSIPLPSEVISSSFYNGDDIGEPPTLELSNLNNSFKFKITNTGSNLDGKPLPILILWGDGTTSEIKANINEIKELIHNYPSIGEYRMTAIARNTSGLRSILIKNITANSAIIPTNPITINKVIFNSVKAYTGIFTFIDYISFDVNGQVQAGYEYKIGQIKATYLGNNSSKVIESRLIANNDNFDVINKIVLIPKYNFNESGYVRLGFSSILNSVYNNSILKDSLFNMEVNVDSIKLYNESNQLITNKELKPTFKNNEFLIYVCYDKIKVSRIEIPIPNRVLKSYYTAPNTLRSKQTEGLYQEKKLNSFFKKNIITDAPKEIIQTPSLKIYPNPTEDRIIISRDSNIREKAVFTIFDMTGRLITTIDISQDLNYYEINLKDISTGNYLWRYEGADNKNLQSGKFVKY